MKRPSALLFAFVVTIAAGCRTEPYPAANIDGGTTSCASLDEAACRARTDCVADTCTECSCTPVFVACRAPNAPQTMCPGLDCPTPLCCHNNAECKNPNGSTFGLLCVSPGQSLGCGVCIMAPSTCKDDQECANGEVCDPVQCACSFSGPPSRACAPGCSSMRPCPTGQTCGSNFRCAATTCTTSCPPNFKCSSGTCQRKSCTVDKDCAGYCVGGTCYEGLGTCEAPPS